MRLRYVLETIIDTDSPMLLPDMVRKLSHHQRNLLIAHYNGLHPFRNEPVENATRRSLIIRGLIRYEPQTVSRVGKPLGTVLTDPDGRYACCMVLGEMANQLTAIEPPIPEDRQRAYYDALAECARHWRNENRRHNFP